MKCEFFNFLFTETKRIQNHRIMNWFGSRGVWILIGYHVKIKKIGSILLDDTLVNYGAWTWVYDLIVVFLFKKTQRHFGVKQDI